MSSASFPLDVLREPGDGTLERLLRGWLGPPAPTAVGARSLPLPVPAALEGGLATLAGWPHVFAQNGLRAPDEVTAERGLGRFLDENQAVCFWGFRLAEGEEWDPPVWADDWQSAQVKVDDHVSTFLLKMTILELILGCDTMQASEAVEWRAKELVVDLSRLDALGPLAWPEAAGLWFYAGPGTLAMANVDPDGKSAFAWRAERTS